MGFSFHAHNYYPLNFICSLSFLTKIKNISSFENQTCIVKITEYGLGVWALPIENLEIYIIVYVCIKITELSLFTKHSSLQSCTISLQYFNLKFKFKCYLSQDSDEI